MHYSTRCISRLLLLVGMFWLIGCGGNSEIPVVPVSGQITLDGQPLADVSISFVPQAESVSSPDVGPGSMAKTDSEGRFTLITVDGRDGAVVASHIIRIVPAIDDSSTPDDPGPRRELRLPKSAQDGSIRFQVPEDGTEQADFKLATRK
ncbi:DUF4198 domain-containing protein [Gimesia fumaroli]|uniref:Carboxypeptidase regulatory-like domain-containing protein n=1 Tax=Gimesia fumaroli TaxID=2527976 RepID=A0A518I9X6_9PLAN|nr:DUF4198 domain-containing protein [Gimesia fumaroli]QDV49864.1 hypothetical protein Enr17x_18850 [Gimesia fumaroli]